MRGREVRRRERVRREGPPVYPINQPIDESNVYTLAHTTKHVQVQQNCVEPLLHCTVYACYSRPTPPNLLGLEALPPVVHPHHRRLLMQQCMPCRQTRGHCQLLRGWLQGLGPLQGHSLGLRGYLQLRRRLLLGCGTGRVLHSTCQHRLARLGEAHLRCGSVLEGAGLEVSLWTLAGGGW